MESRKRLRPWLWKHTDLGDYGLKWVDKEAGIFRMPWIHRSSRGWNKDHCQVFKEWAKFTNKYNEGDVEDYPGWKTRLRTALTKLSKDFEEISDMHNLDDTVNPYKVYKFKSIDRQRNAADSSSSPGYSPGSSQSTDGSQNSPLSYSSSCPIYPQSASPCMSIVGNIPNILESHDQIDFLPDEDNMIGTPTFDLQSSGGSLMKDYQQNTESNIFDNDGKLPSDLQSLDSDILITKLPSTEMNNYKTDSDPNLGEIPQNAQPAQQILSKTPKLSYKIFYLDEIVKEGQLYDEIYHFYFGQIPDFEVPVNLFGPKTSERIKFPDVTEMTRSINSDQQKLMQDILMQMDRGILLKCNEGDIYAQRLCRTRIFANSITQQNQLLDRKSGDPLKVFDLKYFKEHHLGEIKQSPVTHLAFAQEFNFKSMKTLLMHMELTSLEAEELSSPSSINSLQISDLNSGDQLLHEMESLYIQAE